MTMGRLTGAAALLAATAMLTGCGYDIKVSTDRGLSEKSVEVHLVGVNASSISTWKAYSVTEYFTPGDQQLKSAVDSGIAEVMKFGPGMPETQWLLKDNPVWKRWEANNAKYLVVMAFLPGYTQTDDRPGDQDPRRMILPLEEGRYKWTGQRVLPIRVSAGGLNTPVEHKPIKP